MKFYQEPIVCWRFTHKDCPLQIIVSSSNSQLYSLATFLHIIYDFIPAVNSQINNSFQLVEKLSNTYMDEYFKLISLDVVSLFTFVSR